MKICSLRNEHFLSRCVYSDILNRKFPPQKTVSPCAECVTFSLPRIKFKVFPAEVFVLYVSFDDRNSLWRNAIEFPSSILTMAFTGAYCSLRNEMGRNEMEICSLRNENL